VVVSDQVGSGRDFVSHGENGQVFLAGDVAGLSKGISNLMDRPEEVRLKMGEKSWNLINDWSNRDIASVLVEYFQSDGPETNSKPIGFLVKLFQIVPEFIAHAMGVLMVGSLWLGGFTFLLLRTGCRRLRRVLKRLE
jgi:hypothetical protein